MFSFFFIGWHAQIEKSAHYSEYSELNNGCQVEQLPDRTGLRWTLVAPATLWSSQVLRVRGDRPANDFEAKAVVAYLRRCGVPVSYTSVYETTRVTHEFRWPRGLVQG